MNIVIVNRWPRFNDGRRWDGELTRYESFIDHRANTVSYVVNEPGAAGVLVPENEIACRVQVQDVNDLAQLQQAVEQVQEKVGKIDCLIALSEFTLETAARVRAALGIPGPKPEDVATYRDKVKMKAIVESRGVRVPRFRPCVSVEQTLADARELGFPLILKPRDGAGSIGVKKVHSAEELAEALQAVALGRYQIEEYVSGSVFHIDGFLGADGRILFQTVSRYLNTCLDFALGKPLGSVLMNDSPLRRRIEQFSEACCRALELRSTAFHLEVILNGKDEPVFLEIGARVGGGDIAYLLNKQCGVNLYELFLRALVGESVQGPLPAPRTSGGWLLIPKPAELPCKVVEATPMRGQVNTLWRELLPLPGEVLEAGGGYESLQSGRFIFCGESESEVEADIHRVLERFRFQAVRA